MARRTNPSRSSRTGTGKPAPALPEQLAQPDDQGLSLEELGQAYAAIMNRGADPYPQPEEAAEQVPAAPSLPDESTEVLPRRG